jgi:hypothetical protein
LDLKEARVKLRSQAALLTPALGKEDSAIALKIAEKGNVDLVMVHAKSLEEKFIKKLEGKEIEIESCDDA